MRRIITLIWLGLLLISCSKKIQNEQKHEINSIKQKQIITKDEKIICDKFNLKADLKNNILSLNIDSDLPDFTSIIVSISRSYWEINSTDEYPIDYFYEKSNLRKWRNTRSIELNNSMWKLKLQERKETIKKIRELNFEISKISDNISIDVTVHANQPNSKFGDKNINLTGNEVIKENVNFIRKEIDLVFPYH